MALKLTCAPATQVSCSRSTLREVRVLDKTLSGAPDVIFLDPRTKHLYVAIGDSGVIDVIDVATVRRARSHRAAVFVDTAHQTTGAKILGRCLTKWITREHVKIDRVRAHGLSRNSSIRTRNLSSCRRRKITEEAKRLDAIPSDVKNIELGHHGKKCAFEAILKKI